MPENPKRDFSILYVAQCWRSGRHLPSPPLKAAPQERVGLIQPLQILGYRAWAFGEDPRLSKRDVEYSVGGIVAAVREDMRATCEEHLIPCSGEAILINMFSCHIGFLWRRPHEDHATIDDRLYGWHLTATASNMPCCLLGDWNDIPVDAPLC